MRRTGWLLCALALALVPACKDSTTAPPTGGEVITVERAVSGFSSVRLNGVGQLIITQTGSETLTITAEARIIPLLLSTVDGGRLTLGPEAGSEIQTEEEIIYTLTVANLEQIEVTGVGVVNVSGLDTDVLRIIITGVGTALASGRADLQELTISGVGTYLAEDLESKVVSIDISGPGTVLVRVSDLLFGSISAPGLVEYIGDPFVSVTVTGGGTVRPR